MTSMTPPATTNPYGYGIGGSGYLNQDPDAAYCSCPKNDVEGLDEFMDLLLAGFTQREAGWLLYRFSTRSEVDTFLRSL